MHGLWGYSAGAMARVYVVTTSYPEHRGDAQGHFVASEVRRLCEANEVTVLAPGRDRVALETEKIVSLSGEEAFGFPGALARLRERPLRLSNAAQFVASALRWLRHAPTPDRLIAHFLLPCGVPIATRGLGSRRAAVEVVVHGSDARLFARLPFARGAIGKDLLRANAQLRFVSSELHDLVLGALPPAQRRILQARARVEPCSIDVTDTMTREQSRARLGIPESSRVAVIIARLVPSKRVDVALEACRRITDLRTIVVGDGPERTALARRFPAASFVGHVERPLALTYLSAADVLVSASLLEGAPTVVREARALGTPVVCLPAGDVARWAQSDPGIHVVSPAAEP
jgi:teichuronic acid biosynthesis glycosyltransferase TuaC